MNYSEAFEKFRNMHVGVVGDLMLDKYLHGRVERISPEAPVPILQLSHADRRIGGAGNVALNLAGFGSKVHLFAAVADDMEGGHLRQLLELHQIPGEGVIDLDNYYTTVKTRLIGSTQQLMRVDDETYRELNADEMAVFVKNLEKGIVDLGIHGLVLQDYNKGILSAEMIRNLISLAAKHGIPTAVDPKYKHFTLYSPVTIFKPNLRELEAALGYKIEPEVSELDAAIQILRESIDAELFAVTLSDRGIYLADKNKSILVPTKRHNVVDVCGAGDAVVSALMLGYLAGCDLQMLGHLANASGGYVCEKVGVVPVKAAPVLGELQNIR